jgi:hypothetical protein
MASRAAIERWNSLRLLIPCPSGTGLMEIEDFALQPQLVRLPAGHLDARRHRCHRASKRTTDWNGSLASSPYTPGPRPAAVRLP